MTQVERITVSLSKELIHRMEKIRTSMGLNRSKFFQMALKAYLEEFPQEEDRKLARLYQEIRQTDKNLFHHFRGFYKARKEIYEK